MSDEVRTTSRRKLWRVVAAVCAGAAAIAGFTADVATVDSTYISPQSPAVPAPSSGTVASNDENGQPSAADLSTSGPPLQAFIRYRSPDWSADVPTVLLGGAVEVLLVYRNQGERADHVVITAGWPDELGDAPLDTMLKNGNYPNSYQYPDAHSITSGGIDIGSYAANIGAYVRMDVLVADSDLLECGDNYVVMKFHLTSSLGDQSDAQVAVRINKKCD